MNFLVLLLIAAVLAGLRYFDLKVRRLNVLIWLAAWWIGLYLAFRYGIEPPLPSSILMMFMAIVSLSLLVFLSSDSQRLASATRNITRFIVEPRFTAPLFGVVLLIPMLVALRAYIDATRPVQPPLTARTIHPPPPGQIQYGGRTMNLVTAENPYRSLEQGSPDEFRAHVANGRRVYYENCVFCHGDNMEGDGIFAHGFDPIPASFNASTIGILQESYLFWRIAKGAPGLPDEATPWSSAMPAWETFLTEEEIWDVVLFLYDFTGVRPRARDAAH